MVRISDRISKVVETCVNAVVRIQSVAINCTLPMIVILVLQTISLITNL